MKAKKLAQCALFTALIAVSAWISIPFGYGVVTLQTLSVFLCLFVLGGKYGCISVLAYLALGGLGLPVFSSFTGGLGALFGPTGGYLFGLLFGGLGFWLFTAFTKGKYVLLGAAIAQMICYVCGVSWLLMISSATQPLGVGVVLAQTVGVYLLPDALKIALAWILCKKIEQSAK